MMDSLLSVWTLATPLSLAGLSGAVLGLRRRRRGSAAPVRVEPALIVPLLPPAAADVREEPVASLPEVRARLKPRAIVSQARAAEILVEYMNSENQHGYFTAHEIDEWWSCAMSNLDLEHISVQIVREALESRGLRVGQRRLNTPEFALVRQRNPLSVRPVLYRIPRCRGTSGGQPNAPEDDRTHRTDAGVASGRKPEKAPQAVRRVAA